MRQAGELMGAEASQEAMAEAFQLFLERNPQYAETSVVDRLRATEYRRLEDLGQVYLDYTGASLYALSQVTAHLDMLRQGVFGNPHTSSPASFASSELAEAARADILRHFHASPEEYVVIFTQNASGALKLVAESYPFGPGSRLVLTQDNHNSVNGLREYAAAKGAEVVYAPLGPDLRIDEGFLRAVLRESAGRGPSLLALPGQSNFSGVQHDLGWIDEARRQGFDVLLDAAAFAPTNELDLSVCHPDFVAVSFYKMFGYPSGVGSLIARREALGRLVRPWYAGGTVAFASVGAFMGPRSAHRLFDGAQGFEDGTIDYLGVPAVSIGLRHLEVIGVGLLHRRVMLLTGWLLDALGALRHPSGQPRCAVYGPGGAEGRGATVLFNLLDAQGERLDYVEVQRAADAEGISLRSGCHCNPGAREAALGMRASDLRKCFLLPARSSEEFMASVADKLDGGVRASLGIASNFADVYRLYAFLAGYRG